MVSQKICLRNFPNFFYNQRSDAKKLVISSFLRKNNLCRLLNYKTAYIGFVLTVNFALAQIKVYTKKNSYQRSHQAHNQQVERRFTVINGRISPPLLLISIIGCFRQRFEVNVVGDKLVDLCLSGENVVADTLHVVEPVVLEHHADGKPEICLMKLLEEKTTSLG